MKTTSMKYIPGWLLALLALALTACIPASPRLDAELGKAVNIAKALQVANPDASNNGDPVKGIDGQAADAIVDNYRNSYVNPSPALSGGVVNVGSGRGGAGGGGSTIGGGGMGR